MNNRLNILLLLVILLVGGLLSSVLFLNRDSIGTKALRMELEKKINEVAGLEIKTGDITGNPLTGYALKDISILSGNDKEVLKASSLKLGFERKALIKGKINLRSLAFRDADFDMSTIIAVLSGDPARQKPKEQLSLRRIEFTNCSFLSGSSLLEVKDLAVRISSPGEYTGEGKASFNGLDFTSDLHIIHEGGLSFMVRKMDVTSGETTLSLSGRAGNDLELAGTFSTPDLSFLSTLVPRTAKARMSGGVKTDLTITGPITKPRLSGNIQASDFSVARFRFDEGSSQWTFKDRTLSFTEIESNVFGSPVQGDIDIIFTGGPLESRLELSGKELNVEYWYTPLPWLHFASGKLDNMKVSLTGPFKKLSGNISFQTANSTVIEQYPFKELSAELQMKNCRDISLLAEGIWHNAHIKGKGSIKVEKPSTSMNINIETKDLDVHHLKDVYPIVNQLDLQGVLAGNVQLKGKTKQLEISGSFGSDKTRLSNNILEDLRFSFVNSGNITKVSSMEMKYMGSSFKGKGSIQDLNDTSPRGKISLSSPSIKVFETLELKNISSSGTFEKEVLSISSFASNLAGGKMNLSGQVKFIEGNSPRLNLKGNSKSMAAKKLASQLGVPLNLKGKIDSTFSVSGTPVNPEIAATLNSSQLTVSGLPLNSVKASIKARDNKLFIKGIKADLAGSPLRSSGTINLVQGDKDTLDVRTTVESLDLFSFTGKAFPNLPISGVVSTDISFSGALKDPEVTLSASAERFNLGGLNFSGLELETRLGENKQSPIEYLLKAYIGEIPLEITGSANMNKGASPEITFESTGRELDAEKLTEKVNGGLKSTFKGKFDIACNGKITRNSITGEGKLNSPQITIQGYSMNNLLVPFSFNGNKILSEGASAGIYGGKANMKGNIDLDKGKWGMDFSVSGADLARFSRDFKELDVDCTGKGDLEIILSGVLGKIYLLSGTGSLAFQDGTVGGFDALRSLAQDGILKYRTLNTSFNLDGGNIYILPGSRVSAFPDDNVYRYLSFSGALGGPRTNMDLKCSGQINTQALNALQGVIKGIIAGGNEGNAALLLQDFLSGLVGGYSGPDFRMINFELAGTWSNPALYSLEVDSSLKAASTIPVDDSPGTSYEKEIKFEVSIPTGEGSDNSTSAGDQFKKQVMENLIKQIFVDDDDIANGSSN